MIIINLLASPKLYTPVVKIPLEPLQKKPRPLASSYYNFDETRFIIGIIFAGMVVTTSDSLSRAKLA